MFIFVFKAGVYYCHGMGGNQRFRLTGPGQIMFNDYCFYVDGTRVRIDKCNKVQWPSFWVHDKVCTMHSVMPVAHEVSFA